MSEKQNKELFLAFSKGFDVGCTVGEDVSKALLEAIQDLVDDLKLRASFTDAPNVLNVSSSKLIKAEKAIVKAYEFGIE